MLTSQVALVFMIEAGHQCRALLRSATELEQTTIRASRASGEDILTEIDDVWRHIQGILIASANVSKILWGSGGKSGEREPLRRLIGISDDSPLRDPDLRNDFEHFDERVETFYSSSEAKGFTGRNIGNMGGDTSNRFHHYDPQTGGITFLGHAVSLPALVDEARWLADRLRPENLINLWEAIDREFPV